MPKLPEYTSIEEKMKFFSGFQPQKGIEFLLKSKHDVDTLLKTYSPTTDFVFRGLNNSRYKLFSSAQRFWIVNELNYRMESFNDFIKKTIELTRIENGNTISNFLENLSGQKDDLEILGFIQHHGGPTPLMDFTKSVKVPLYFACQSNGSVKNSDDEIDNYISLYVLSKKVKMDNGEEMDFLNNPWERLLKRKDSMSEEDQKALQRGMRFIDAFLESFKSFRGVYIDTYIMKKFNLKLITSMNILNQKGVFFL